MDIYFYFFFWGGGGHHKILGSFLCVNDFLGVAKISNIFEVLEIPDISWGLTVDAGPDPTYEEKIELPQIEAVGWAGWLAD